MKFTWEFTGAAFKEFKKHPKSIQQRIIKKLDYFISTDKPLEFAENLINSEIGEYRFRVGDYRVIFDLESTSIVILSVGHRREIYK